MNLRSDSGWFKPPYVPNGSRAAPVLRNGRGFDSGTDVTEISHRNYGLLLLYLMVIGALALIDFLIAPLDSDHATVVIVATIVLFGMPHGALDVYIAMKLGLMRDRLSSFRFLAFYIAAAGGVLMVWFTAPIVALAFFLLLSAYHFAEEWDDAFGPIGAACMGISTLAAPALFHTDQVRAIFVWLAGNSGGDLVELLRVCASLMIVVAGYGVLSVYRRVWVVAIELAAIIISAFLLPPLAYFGALFCILHAPRHIASVQRRFAGDPIARLLRFAAPWAFAASVGVIAMAVSLGDRLTSIGSAGTAALFMILSALTVPHTWLISRMNNRG